MGTVPNTLFRSMGFHYIKEGEKNLGQPSHYFGFSGLGHLQLYPELVDRREAKRNGITGRFEEEKSLEIPQGPHGQDLLLYTLII